jgi:hypothetical protein
MVSCFPMSRVLFSGECITCAMVSFSTFSRLGIGTSVEGVAAEGEFRDDCV